MSRKETLQQLFNELFNEYNLIGKGYTAMYVIDKKQALEIAKKYKLKIQVQKW